jgi:uncharacterized SAM-binding protein YcdF (DUF218 family)
MFVLLKILLFFFSPVVWIITLFLLSFFTKREKGKKIFFRTAMGALLFFTNPAVIRLLESLYESKPVVLAKNAQYNAGIVLGGFVSYNLHDDRGYFNAASDRFIQTALLYQTGKIKKIIIPAGNGYIVQHNFHEADFIKEQLVQLGIPAGDIYTDPFSRNTIENAANTKKLVDSLHMSGPFLLITSALHMPRASRLFIKQGLQVQPYPCDFSSRQVANNIIQDDLLPSSSALVHWDKLMVEWIGRFGNAVMGKD